MMGGVSWVIFHCVFLLVSLVFCSLAPADEEYVTIDVLKANDLIRSAANYGYLDVRTEEEFEKGHVGVGNPLNIAYMFDTPEGRVKNPNFLEQVLALCNKDDHLIVGCQSGVRSVYATIDLQNADFKHVYNMGGGYLAWVKNDLPVTKPEAENALPVNLTTQPKVDNSLHTTLIEPKVDNGSHVAVVEPEVENDLPVTVTEPKMENDHLPVTVAEPEVKNWLPVTLTETKIEL